jgi:hypothetical protein
LILGFPHQNTLVATKSLNMDKNDSNSFEKLVRAEQERQKKYENSFKELREEAQERQKSAGTIDHAGLGKSV